MIVTLFHATEEASQKLLAFLSTKGVSPTLVRQTPHERWYDIGDEPLTAAEIRGTTDLLVSVLLQEPIAVDAHPTAEDFTGATEILLKKEANALGYDSIVSACSYATSTNPKFAAEGQAFVVWRDAMWGMTFSLVAGYEESGVFDTREEFIDKLPVFVPPSIA